jgi:hypothetical protein
MSFVLSGFDSLKLMQLMLHQQTTVLNQIANKLNISLEMPSAHAQLASRQSVIPSDGLTVPDTLQVGGMAGGSSAPGIERERHRQRSVRIALDKSERPRSMVL